MSETGKETVLVIEPGEGIRQRLKQALPGAELVFSSALNFLTEAARKHPGVILMDAHMPGSDGFTICQRLSMDPVTQDVPILYITGSLDQLAELDPHSERIIATDDLDSLAHRVSKLARYQRVREFVKDAIHSGIGDTGLTEHEIGVLESGGFSVDAELNLKPIAEGAAAYAHLTETSLTVALAAEKLGVTAGRVRQRLTASPAELFGFRTGKLWMLPAFQFGSTDLVPNIERVIAKLDPGLNPVAVDRWFRLENLDLELGEDNVSPLEWLSQGGGWQRVADLAEDL